MEELLCTKVYKRIQTCINICCTVRLLTWLESEYSYNPAKKVFGFLEEGDRNQLVRLSVCPSLSVCTIVSGPYLSYGGILEVHTKIAYELRVCHNINPSSFGQVYCN